MGLPNINIVFKTKGVNAVKRSERGIVAVILKDDTAGDKLKIYKGMSEIDHTEFSAKNYDYLKLVYAGNPSKVVVVKIATTEANYNKALKTLKDLKWNYLTVPTIDSGNLLSIATFIKEQRNKQKTFKVILPKYVGDSEGIINFTNDNIKSNIVTNIETLNTAEYCARIAGMLAGLPLSISSTYYVFADIISADVFDNADEKINAGEFIIIFDGANYKVGRGVNSLTTFTTEKSKEFSKIKIVEGVDLYNDDIKTTFEDYYIGKYRNDYDNKQALVSAINAYNKALQGDVLDSSFDNVSKIDINAQRQFLEAKGIDTSAMDDIEILKANTGSEVFITSNIKFVDAMEDLTMVNHM